MSAAASQFRLLDPVVTMAVRLSDGLVVCDLKHRRRVAALCIFYKIRCSPNHALEAALTEVRVHAMLTRLLVSIHFGYVDVHRHVTAVHKLSRGVSLHLKKQIKIGKENA